MAIIKIEKIGVDGKVATTFVLGDYVAKHPKTSSLICVYEEGKMRDDLVAIIPVENLMCVSIAPDPFADKNKPKEDKA